MVDFAFEIRSLKRLLEAQQIATMSAVRRAEKADADLAHIRKREEEVIVRLCNRIQDVESERDKLRAQLDAERETFVDAHGTTWLRPTAEAYYLVYKARDKHQSELAKERERADAHYRALENVTTKNERLTAERDALRANLRDELERADAWHKTFLQTQAERDALRELLREARAFCPGDYYANDRLRARIDAALKERGDE